MKKEDYMKERLYSVGEVTELLSVSRSAVLRLCRTGLVPAVRRDRRYHRVFTDQQITHIRIILGLRQAGLKTPELRRYTRLVRQGRAALPEQKALLETQKRQLWQNLESIQRSIDFLERQIELIDQDLTNPDA